MACIHTPVVYAKNTCKSASPAASVFQMAETLQQSYDQILAFTFLGVVPVLINVLVVGTNFCQWN